MRRTWKKFEVDEEVTLRTMMMWTSLAMRRTEGRRSSRTEQPE